MANEEHVALLKSSSFFEETPEWNVWRQQNPDIRPDLVEGVSLRRTWLMRTSIRRTCAAQC
jgi:hypothetical protein